MQKKIFVYDPTLKDEKSAVRGIGRYLQIFKESFGESWIFTDDVGRISADSIFVNPFYNFLKFPLTLKRIAKKQIAVIHDLIPLKYPSYFPAGIKGSIYILLNKLALKNYDLIITDSEASKKDIVEILKIKNQKVKIIYPCLPKSFLKLKIENLDLNENWKLKIENSYCLYVGDATWNKNLVNIARAIKIANVTCVFVGKVFGKVAKVASEEALREADCRDNRQSLAEEECHEQQNLPQISHPWQAELNEFIKLTKNDKRFIFAGFVPDKELIKLYQQARCNILVSRDEGFGFSYLEAAFQVCPSVLSNISVLKEIAGENNALFADPNDPHQIANAIGELYFNHDIRNNLGFKAQQRSKYFSQEKFKTRWQAAILSNPD